MPRSQPGFRLRTDYAPFPTQPAERELASFLHQVQVREAMAVHYLGRSGWQLPRRRSSSDLLLLVRAGTGQVEIDDRSYRIHPGLLAHARLGTMVALQGDPGEELSVILLHHRATVAGATALSSILGFPDLFPIGDDHPIGAILDEACRECALRPPGWERGAEALALRILLHLVRDFAGLLAPVRSPRDLGDLHRLIPALDAMRADLATPLPVRELSARCSLSEPQFRRIFLRVLGRSPVQYLRQLRMEEACRLLRDQALPVAEIARLVGYSEPAFFSRTFTRLMGTTPGRFRTSG